MADKKILRTTIKLRRDTVNHYASYPDHIPLNGEVCIVDPTSSTPWEKAKSIRIKIGDGVTKWSELDYVDNENSSVICGYYFEGDFYYDINHLEPITAQELDLSKLLFVDLHAGVIYYYDVARQVYIATTTEVPVASAERPGIMRLYQTYGENVDGTMSQKAITDAISQIELAVDEADPEAFMLRKPW